MKTRIDTVEEYINLLPEDRKSIIEKLRNIIKSNLPSGFEEQISYGMVGYVVPLTLFPPGYHTKAGEPLPFITLASQKRYISIYHMGIYGNEKVMQWFVNEYKKSESGKLDMGKSCIRFKNMNNIPYELIGELCQKISVEEFIRYYEKSMRK